MIIHESKSEIAKIEHSDSQKKELIPDSHLLTNSNFRSDRQIIRTQSDGNKLIIDKQQINEFERVFNSLQKNGVAFLNQSQLDLSLRLGLIDSSKLKKPEILTNELSYNIDLNSLSHLARHRCRIGNDTYSTLQRILRLSERGYRSILKQPHLVPKYNIIEFDEFNELLQKIGDPMFDEALHVKPPETLRQALALYDITRCVKENVQGTSLAQCADLQVNRGQGKPWKSFLSAYFNNSDRFEATLALGSILAVPTGLCSLVTTRVIFNVSNSSTLILTSILASYAVVTYCFARPIWKMTSLLYAVAKSGGVKQEENQQIPPLNLESAVAQHSKRNQYRDPLASIITELELNYQQLRTNQDFPKVAELIKESTKMLMFVQAGITSTNLHALIRSLEIANEMLKAVIELKSNEKVDHTKTENALTKFEEVLKLICKSINEVTYELSNRRSEQMIENAYAIESILEDRK